MRPCRPPYHGRLSHVVCVVSSVASVCVLFCGYRLKDRMAAQTASAVRAAVETSEAEARELAKTVRSLQAKLADAGNVMAEAQRVCVVCLLTLLRAAPCCTRWNCVVCGCC